VHNTTCYVDEDKQQDRYSPHNIEHLAISKRPAMKDAPPLQIRLTSLSQALDSNIHLLSPSPQVAERKYQYLPSLITPSPIHNKDPITSHV